MRGRAQTGGLRGLKVGKKCAWNIGMTNAEKTLVIMHALGWQGGTIHQVEQETGLKSNELWFGDITDKGHGDCDSARGWLAVRTCSLEHNRKVNWPRYRGNLNFWLGVMAGQRMRDMGL